MGYETIISYFIGALAVLFCGWLFSLKIKGLVKIAANAAAGGMLLLALSLFLPVHIPLNPVTSLLAGLLGVPGVALTVAIALFL